jgi:hypothetical protein
MSTTTTTFTVTVRVHGVGQGTAHGSYIVDDDLPTKVGDYRIHTGTVEVRTAAGGPPDYTADAWGIEDAIGTASHLAYEKAVNR